MSITDQIAKVLRGHRWRYTSLGDATGCACSWAEGVDMNRDEYAAHVAEKVAELFTEEERSFYDHAEPYGTAYEHRWVSDWFTDD